MRSFTLFLFGLIALTAVVFAFEMFNNQRGEIVDCSKLRTRTIRDKLDRLYDIACFDSVRVQWRSCFVKASLVSMLTIYLIALINNIKDDTKLINTTVLLLLGAFLINYSTSSFTGFHGPSWKHPALAYKLRVRLEQEITKLQSASLQSANDD